MRLLKEMTDLSNLNLELQSLANDLKTLRLQTSGLTSLKF